jgi:crossover junction endodeoxyribonuclease RuvC
MLQRLMQIEEQPHFFDATDALAVALCHHYATSSGVIVQKKSLKGWQGFIAQNPDRVIR